MIPYMLMIAIPGFFALTGARRAALAFLLVALLYWLMIGFRYQIGMDWNNYWYIYLKERHQSLAKLLGSREPGYSLLNYVAARTGAGFMFVNGVAGLVFSGGFFAVARRCREPFIAIVVGTPLLVVAFAMSGVRQSIAIGIIFLLFASWDRRTTLSRCLYVLVAMLFHFSALFVLILVAAASRLPAAVRVIIAVVLGAVILAIISVAPEAMETYSSLYVSGQGKLSAPGAVIQVGAVALAALVYLVRRKQLEAALGENRLYEYIAWASLAALPSILVSSVGAYRFVLYFWAMAMYTWAGVPATIASANGRALFRLSIVVASFAVLIGWLAFANNSAAWIPYENWLLQPQGAPMFRPRFTH